MTQTNLSLHDRIHGCLLAGACGDALGAAVEFQRADRIRAIHGPEGITAFGLAYGRVGAITDDTQMTLFTAEGLIRSHVRGATRGIRHTPSVVHGAYLRWLATQEGQPPGSGAHPDLDGWLVADRRLWSTRAPGNTCLSALRASRRAGLGDPAVNDSKGCGTVMRDAPFGFLRDRRQAIADAMESARLTHGHPSAAFASGAIARIIHALVHESASIRDAVQAAIATFADTDAASEVTGALGVALALSSEPDWRARLPELGHGWVAEEALAIAVLCALAADSLRDALVAAVNHDGDSDSTGAIAGNILGAHLGPAAIPDEWSGAVELADVVAIIAADLTAMLEWRFDAEAEWVRYPGH